ncbi:acyl-[acyl-carrier-protein]--UDP-N-acetylglucosamine O-acyltransferase [Archangium gephyra]|uniref:Acyl-[acyl-carrier-protein]--UDP-N-acetylglucosamine O-acyltransferase n=1 Tax=Archangium gephyra TaxID=48 RepID=A0AAC8Q8M7_9BACT|nr:acyl-ACP--UDP-N-acetylglucosamine O-acyltransferase [Archangium gephyra]AKJ02586.1 Acyl-[acyl-carrier-protein]--UDP-N-acetylglucosamine O-acyltransferase [Archangium gephyra]REG28494.1 acyl-[acyl-carrier-protein]--UDP-N-acetylglucosamine O-acyltransferase [Archangium gephyra]
MAQVHPTAVVHPGARLHETVEVGPYSVIGEKVTIGEGSRVGPHVVIDGRTTIGARNRIFPFASVGGAPQDLKYAGEDTQLIIGDGNTLRESTTLNIGTAGGGGVTRVGNNNLFMAYSHVAHDCVVGSGCVIANSVALAGHVVLEDSVILGGLSAVHQFTRLGKHAFIAGGSMVVMDVAPYCTAQGDRAELAGLNVVGLQRHGFSEEQIGRIKEAYKILFRSKLQLAEALAQLKAEMGGQSEIDYLVDFVSQSKRGLTR